MYGPRRIDATGTRRRLQALALAGWPMVVVARRVPCQPEWLRAICRGGTQYVDPRIQGGVNRVFRELWDLQGPSVHARARAVRRGYVSGAAWDDIDRDAGPADTPTARRATRASWDLDELRALRALGLQDWEIARRFGVQVEALQRREGKWRAA